MTFLNPGWLFAAMAASAIVVALHLFARRRPLAQRLPTARFIPPHSAQATTRAIRPTDLLLLLLRVLILMATGAGLARPVLAPERETRRGIILADVSRASETQGAVAHRVAAVRREGDVIIPFDSAPHAPLPAGGALPAASAARGSLSAALIAAIDAGRTLQTRADSVELTIVSPLRADEFDRATDSVRALWPGRITVARLGAAPMQAALPTVQVRGAEADPLLAAVRRHLPRQGTRAVRLVRNGMTGADSAWAGESGRVLVDWPASGGTAPRDTAPGLVAGDAVLVAPFVRSHAPREGSVVARWSDGTPAATERAVGLGCVRHIAIAVPTAGDLVLRAEFGRVLRELTVRCSAMQSSPPAGDAAVARIAGAGRLAVGGAFPLQLAGRRSLAPWLLAFALGLALLEPFVRGRKALA